jgi:hypothetical protein
VDDGKIAPQLRRNVNNAAHQQHRKNDSTDFSGRRPLQLVIE